MITTQNTERNCRCTYYILHVIISNIDIVLSILFFCLSVGILVDIPTLVSIERLL